MGMTTTANPSSQADELQIHFSKRLLQVQKPSLVMNQEGLAVMGDLPKNIGGRSMRLFKCSRPSSTLRGASPTLTTDVVGKFAIGGANEGVAISTFRENPKTHVDVVLEEWVQATKVSDVAGLIGMFDYLRQNIELMGMDAALFADSMSRNALVGSVHPDATSTPLTHGSDGTNGCELFVNGAGTFVNGGTSATNFTNLQGLTQAAGKLTHACILGGVTRLKVNEAPMPKGGRPLFLLPPQQQSDLCTDDRYETAFNGQGNKGVFNRELGILDGVRFVEHTNPFIEDEVYGTYDSTDNDGDGLVYTGLMIAAGAFGTPKLAGTKSPEAPRIYISTGASKIDPADQFSVAAWKYIGMAMGLDSLNIVAIRSKSTFIG